MFLQNDLVHGWGLDFALRRCVDVSDSLLPPARLVGVLMSLRNQTPSAQNKAGEREREKKKKMKKNYITS